MTTPTINAQCLDAPTGPPDTAWWDSERPEAPLVRRSLRAELLATLQARDAAMRRYDRLEAELKRQGKQVNRRPPLIGSSIDPLAEILTSIQNLVNDLDNRLVALCLYLSGREPAIGVSRLNRAAIPAPFTVEVEGRLLVLASDSENNLDVTIVDPTPTHAL